MSLRSLHTDLRMLTVYNSPRERPGGAVIRGWTARQNGAADFDVIPSVFPSLRAAMETKPPGAHVIPRQPGDDPSIVETWV